MQLDILVDEYIIDMFNVCNLDYYDFLCELLVEWVECVYLFDEVKYLVCICDKMCCIDFDMIYFVIGSVDILMNEVGVMKWVVQVMKKIIDKNLGEIFFIEGYMDVVGLDQFNLVFFDKCVEFVVVILLEFYDILLENLVIQGYGEWFFKVQISGFLEENCCVMICCIILLVCLVVSK